MPKITCKQCRRLGQSICGRDNCAIRRKPYPPGQQGKNRRRRVSEYGKQLMEKQKLKLLYGVREKQFRNYFNTALEKTDARTDQELLTTLEMRLDNAVFRLGIAETRRQARQMVSHGHITVNGRKVTIPSYALSPEDAIAIREGSRNKGIFTDLPVKIKNYETPSWLQLDKKNLTGTVLSTPSKDDLSEIPVEVAQIVEFYSR